MLTDIPYTLLGLVLGVIVDFVLVARYIFCGRMLGVVIDFVLVSRYILCGRMLGIVIGIVLVSRYIIVCTDVGGGTSSRLIERHAEIMVLVDRQLLYFIIRQLRFHQGSAIRAER